jgi:hypothetical protein
MHGREREKALLSEMLAAHRAHSPWTHLLWEEEREGKAFVAPAVITGSH